MTRLWGTTPAGVSTFSDGSSWTQGDAFEPTIPGFITALRWYRPATGSTYVPTRLALWQVTGATLLYDAASIPDNGAVGWQTHTCSAPIQVAAGVDLVVSAFYPAGRPFATTAVANAPTPGSGLAWLSPKRRYLLSNAFPSAVNDAANVTPTDIEFSGTDVPLPSDNTDNFNLDNALARWFTTDPDENKRQGEIPWLDHLGLATLDAKTQTLVDDLDAASWPVVIGGVNKANLPAWLTTAGTIISAAADLSQIVKDWLGDPVAPAAGTTNAKLDLIAEAEQPAINWAAGRVLATAYHVFEDDEPISGVTRWAPGFGLFKVSISAWSTEQASIELPGSNYWLPRLGWWAPIFAGSELGERKFLEFQTEWLWPLPMGAVGVLVYVGPATTGTIERYVTV